MTPNATYPGVYVEEAPSGVRTIAGVSTSVAAFVGACKTGRSNYPVRVTSFAEFERLFGGLASGLELGYSVQQFFLNGGTDAWVVRVARIVTAARFVKGISALDAVDIFNLLVLPGITVPAILTAAADYCYKRRAFLIVDAPSAAKTPAAMVQETMNNAFPKSSNGAVYYPWIKISDPLKKGQPRPAPPGGAVAGVIARTDNTRGVWKSPSGIQANLVGVTALEYNMTDAENGTLNPLGVNSLRIFPASGPVVWGGRTLLGNDLLASEWKYIPVRRLALFIEESIYRGTNWAVFEPNAEPLWAQIRLNIGAFLNTLFRQGAFQGVTQQQAYFVKCDQETTSSADIARGVMNIVVGFAPLKPAEFVIIRIAQAAHLPQ